MGSPPVRSKYANVKSRIDQSDPNPAHQLKHSVKDLTIDSEQGRRINPRFTQPSPSYLIQRRRRSDINDNFPLTTCHRRSPLTLSEQRVQRSQSLDLGISRSPHPRHHQRSPRVDCVFPVSAAAASPKIPGRVSSMDEQKRFPHQSVAHGSTFETIEEDEGAVGGAVALTASPAESTTTTTTTTTTTPAATRLEAYTGRLLPRLSEEESEESDDDDDDNDNDDEDYDGDIDDSDDLRISGMEITSSDSETTVYLQHVLQGRRARGNDLSSSSSSTSTASTTSSSEPGSGGAATAVASGKSSVSAKLSGSPRHHQQQPDMAVIEEDEEESYYESPDAPQQAVAAAAAAAAAPVAAANPPGHFYTLPHPIPRLIVTNEKGEIVETIVQNATIFTGVLMPGDAIILPPSSVPAGPPPHPVAAATPPPSVAAATPPPPPPPPVAVAQPLNPTIEEEEELEACNLSTRL